MQVLATLFREVAGQDPQQLVQIGADGAVGRLLDSQVFEHRHARGGADAPGRGTQQLLVHPATLRVVGDRDLLQGGAHGVHSVHVRGKKGFVTEVFLDQDRGQSRQAPGVATRCTRRWKSAIFAVSVTTGSITIIDGRDPWRSR